MPSFNRPIPVSLFNRAKYRAKKKNIPFDLRKEDVVVPDLCPILGIPLKRGSVKNHDAAPSLDRIDTTRGYTRGNVAVISNRANTIKNNATPQELQAVYLWLQEKLLFKKA